MRTKQFMAVAFSAITVVGIFSASCKKSNNSNPPDPYKKDSLNATINDLSFVARGDSATGYHDTADHVWSIIGLRASDSAIVSLFIADTFTINQPVTTRSSALQYSSHSGVAYYNYIGAGNTTITVTSLDTANHMITGTFSGNLTTHGVIYLNQAVNDTAVVTTGKFSVYYTISKIASHP